jgi:hypothetical protein
MSTRTANRRAVARLSLAVVSVLALTFTASGIVSGALVAGSLPTAGFTYLSATQNSVNIAGEEIRLKIKDSVTVKTTYSIVAPGAGFVGGWHYHLGPVMVTVAVGTLTLYDSACGSWNITAGETYIEAPGQVLNARALPANNTGATVEWFTTRLIPSGASDPVSVAAPCEA